MNAAIALITITSIISYRGLTNESFLSRYSFVIYRVRVERDYIRLVSSGFLHVDWLHLVVNMLVLFVFGSSIERSLGAAPMTIIYLASMVGGNLLALLIHAHRANYASVGASGAVSGLVFATIALDPNAVITLFPIPLPIPNWIFGVLYVVYTLYAIKSRRTDVGHAAHLGGALIGLITALLFRPMALVSHWWQILLIVAPAGALIVIMVYRPDLILIDKRTRKKQLTVDDRFNLDAKKQREDVDRILEKINETGLSSLSRNERRILEEYSRK